MKRHFFCSQRKGICQGEKCAQFQNCTNSVKAKFQEWNEAYHKGNKGLLEKIIRGGM